MVVFFVLLVLLVECEVCLFWCVVYVVDMVC